MVEQTAAKKAEVVARDFSQLEITEINQYITTNVPMSELQHLLVITENPINKAKIFTTIYRLVDSGKNVVKEPDTKRKLTELLEETKDSYDELYSALQKYEYSAVSFGKHRVLRRLTNVFMDQAKNSKINKLIDIFLVFHEKQQIFDVNKIAGIDLENDSGEQALKDIMNAGNAAQN